MLPPSWSSVTTTAMRCSTTAVAGVERNLMHQYEGRTEVPHGLVCRFVHQLRGAGLNGSGVKARGSYPLGKKATERRPTDRSPQARGRSPSEGAAKETAGFATSFLHAKELSSVFMGLFANFLSGPERHQHELHLVRSVENAAKSEFSSVISSMSPTKPFMGISLFPKASCRARRKCRSGKILR